MSIVRGENKIALLLASLPRPTAESVLTRLGPERSDRLRGLIDQARDEASPELLDEVLREFEEMLFQATRSAQRLRLAPHTDPMSDSYEPSDMVLATAASQNAGNSQQTPARIDTHPASELPPVDEAIAELRLIEVDRLVAALQGEHPRGVATVLSCLDAHKASEALLRLPADVRNEVFPRLGQATSGASDVSIRIVRAVVAKSRAAAADPGQSSGAEKAQMMADVLKSMERSDRSALMTALAERDSELAAAVRDRLYVFDDLTSLDGHSMQKLLSEIDSKTLAVALQDAPEIIFDKVISNLSKRARESLAEEMSFLEAISAVQVQQARKAMVDVIQRMDQAAETG